MSSHMGLIWVPLMHPWILEPAVLTCQENILPSTPRRHSQQDRAWVAFWIHHCEWEVHRSLRKAGDACEPVQPSGFGSKQAVGGGKPLVHQQLLGLMQCLPHVVDRKEHWQRHWEIPGQEHVSLRTFWTLCLQIIHLSSLSTFLILICKYSIW